MLVQRAGDNRLTEKLSENSLASLKIVDRLKQGHYLEWNDDLSLSEGYHLALSGQKSHGEKVLRRAGHTHNKRSDPLSTVPLYMLRDH